MPALCAAGGIHLAIASKYDIHGVAPRAIDHFDTRGATEAASASPCGDNPHGAIQKREFRLVDLDATSVNDATRYR